MCSAGHAGVTADRVRPRIVSARTRYASRLCPLSRIVSGGRTLTASGWSPPGLGPLADYVRLDTSYLFNSRYCPGRHYPTPLTLSRRTLSASRYCPGGHYIYIYASRYNIILSRRTLSASRYCPGGHNLLADSVRGHNQDKNNCSISSKCCIIIYNKLNVAQ